MSCNFYYTFIIQLFITFSRFNQSLRWSHFNKRYQIQQNVNSFVCLSTQIVCLCFQVVTTASRKPRSKRRTRERRATKDFLVYLKRARKHASRCVCLRLAGSEFCANLLVITALNTAGSPICPRHLRDWPHVSKHYQFSFTSFFIHLLKSWL